MTMYEKSKEFFNNFNALFEEGSKTREIAIQTYQYNKPFTDFIISQINCIIEKQGLKSQNEYFRIENDRKARIIDKLLDKQKKGEDEIDNYKIR